MRRLIENVIKTAFIATFVFLSGCNNNSFDPNEGLNEEQLLDPTYAKLIDFDNCYENWNLTIEQRSSTGNSYVPLDLSTNFLRDDIEYSSRKLVTYNNDRYTYVSLIYLYKRNDTSAKSSLSISTDSYNVIQLYGLDYNIKIDGVKKETYKEEQIDINMYNFSLNPLNSTLNWSINLFERDENGNETEHIKAKGHENGDTKKFQHFILRRNLKYGYFAINYKRMGSDQKAIEHFYDNKFSFKIEYSTSKKGYIL